MINDLEEINILNKLHNLGKAIYEKDEFYQDLLNYRNISDEVGYNFQVMHQSPQLLVIKNGVSVFDASHYDITQTDLSRFI